MKLISRTDLHTHFLGILSTKKILNIALKYNYSIPIAFWPAEIEYNQEQIDNDSILLNKLTKYQLNAYQSKLEINKNCIFSELTKTYYYRSIYFKDENILKNIFIFCAKDYKKRHIKYVELSSKWFDDTNILNLCDQLFPLIEKEYHVKFRFLCAVDRNYPQEKLNLYYQRIKKVITNKYISGCDISGMESDSIMKIESFISKIAKLCHKNNKTIRIHAGEENILDNIINTLLIIDKLNLNNLKIRLGHCLYGLNSDAISLCHKLDAIIELNITSNKRLHNIFYDYHHLINIILKNHLNFVIGTDGYGIFKTNTSRELYFWLLESRKPIILLKHLNFTENKILNNSY